MIKWIKVAVIVSILAISPFIAGWFVGYQCGENEGYVNGYQYAASAAHDAIVEHLEARDKLRDALADLMEYKIKLQEKEGRR